MNEEYPPCPRCGMPSTITKEEVILQDGSMECIKVCIEKNCKTNWVHNPEGDYFVVHILREITFGESYGINMLGEDSA